MVKFHKKSLKIKIFTLELCQLWCTRIVKVLLAFAKRLEKKIQIYKIKSFVFFLFNAYTTKGNGIFRFCICDPINYNFLK